jgi:hypothetical protein
MKRRLGIGGVPWNKAREGNAPARHGDESQSRCRRQPPTRITGYIETPHPSGRSGQPGGSTRRRTLAQRPATSVRGLRASVPRTAGIAAPLNPHLLVGGRTPIASTCNFTSATCSRLAKLKAMKTTSRPKGLRSKTATTRQRRRRFCPSLAAKDASAKRGSVAAARRQVTPILVKPEDVNEGLCWFCGLGCCEHSVVSRL